MVTERRCFACGKSSKDILLHKFPEVTSQRYAEWKQFCRSFLPSITEEDSFRNCYLCRDHFVGEDYTTPNRLKKHAIPSLISKEENEAEIGATCNTTVEAATSSSNLEKNEAEIGATCNTTVEAATSSSNLENYEAEFAISNFRGEEGTPSSRSTRKRRWKIEDFSKEDMSSQKKATQYYTLSKKMLGNRNKRIKLLNQRCKRLSRKVSKLSELVQHLKKLNSVSEQLEEIILGYP